jgi:hypothetical protein
VLLDRSTLGRGYFCEGPLRDLLDRHAVEVQDHS